MSSTLPTTRSPAPRANRISVSAGVRDTIRCGSAGSVTAVPSSSVSVNGYVAATDGTAIDGDAAVATGDEVPPDEQATTTSATKRRNAYDAVRAAGEARVGTMRLQGNERESIAEGADRPRAGQR